MNGLMFGVPANPRLEGVMPRPSPPAMQSPELLGGGTTPAVNTILASPLAERLAGTIIQQQEMALEAKIVDAVRTALHFLANRKRMVDPKQAAQIERMAAQLLSFFPVAPMPSAQRVQQMASPLQTPTPQGPPGPVSTGMPLI